MGSISETDPDRYDNETQHEVTLTEGFWLLNHELTQKEYKSVMGVNKSEFKEGSAEDRPVEWVNWADAVNFCKKLTERDQNSGTIARNQEYRLPTEAEWEYACRAGTKGAVYVNYGNRDVELGKIAWWRGNSDNRTHTVMEKWQGANAWGLYDMIGNVAEWCSDWFDDYPNGPATNPKGPGPRASKVLRGASWRLGQKHARSAFRDASSPGFGYSNATGFRPALSVIR